MVIKKFGFNSSGMPLYKVGEEVDVQITGNKKILGNKRMKNIGIRLIFLGLVMILLLIILQIFN